jgi:hypothetical protein
VHPVERVPEPPHPPKKKKVSPRENLTSEFFQVNWTLPKTVETLMGKLQLRKYLGPGECLPAWYGIAWVEWQSDRGVCYPVPLNIIAGVIRATWIWLRHGWRIVPVNSRDAYAQGLRDGRNENQEKK